jgi:hypothetical protein
MQGTSISISRLLQWFEKLIKFLATARSDSAAQKFFVSTEESIESGTEAGRIEDAGAGNF